METQNLNCTDLIQYAYSRVPGGGGDVAQAVEHSPIKVRILLHGGSILHLQIGLFSVPTSGTTGPSKAVVCAVMSVRKCI